MSTDALAQIRALLSTTAPRWERLCAELPAELLNRPAAEGEWSAVDCLRHLLDAERQVFPPRVEAFLAGRDFPAFDPNAQGSAAGGESPAELAALFAVLRRASLDRLAILTAADFDRRANHAELGPVTLGQLLHEWAAHDLNHTVQAERALMQPFIAACGPWRVYFTDHEIVAG